METMEGQSRQDESTPLRRRHSPALKAQVVAACAAKGAVVGEIAAAHGLNESMVRRWIREAKQRGGSGGHATTTIESNAGPGFVAVTLPTGVNVASARPCALTIHLRCRRGPTLVEMDWPLQAASECATWLRQWLR